MKRYLTILFLLLFCGLSAYGDVGMKFKLPEYVEHVDLVELNHFYGNRGELVFDQIIFYDKHPDSTLPIVREWRLIKDGRKTYSEAEIIDHSLRAKQDFIKEHNLGKDEIENLDGASLWCPKWIGSPKFVKYKDYSTGQQYILIKEDDGYRKVYFKSEAETFTQWDSELLNRDIVPKEKRIPFKIIPKYEKPYVKETPAEPGP